jgi:hypothetical protein
MVISLLTNFHKNNVNPKNFHNATQGGPNNTQTDIWLTPPWLIDKIGISDLDPCGWLPNGKPIVNTAKNYFTKQENGLLQKWYGMVFCNFPYSESKMWLQKCREEYVSGRCEIIVLCFNRSETKAFQENVKFATGINCINKRISFLDANGNKKTNGNAPSILIAFGNFAYSKIVNVDGICMRIDK